ncbi:MAG: aminopeptidase, partial [Erysipelotrichales bacterium]|nr:aminopeptidase [Erysipelotrichales bacterium]
MKTVWKKYSGKDLKKVFDFAEGYKEFISVNKTERECTEYAVKTAKEHGYVDLNEFEKSGKKLKAGDKVYVTNRGKNFAAFLIGEKPLSEGIRLLGAHIDSPR